MILYISEINRIGSGYTSIGLGLCRLLHGWQGQEVVALSFSYQREEHDEPFRLVPSSPRLCSGQINSLCADKSVGVRAVIVALDIPQILELSKLLQLPPNIPLFAIFPVESEPLTNLWLIGLWRMQQRFVISRFGEEVCRRKGLPVQYLPVPPALEYTPAVRTFRNETRSTYAIPEDAFLILTVADNQERKNLYRTFEIVSGFMQRHEEAYYCLVTRPDSPMGFVIDDALREVGIYRRTLVLDRSKYIPNSQLARIYGAADAFLLTSKAEGLGLPVREAQACGLLVAATDCTGLTEQVSEGKGIGIISDCSYRDPWGNTRRYLVSLADGIEALEMIYNMPLADQETMRAAALAPLSPKEMSWEKSAEIIRDALLPYLVPAVDQQQAQISILPPLLETEASQSSQTS